MRRTLVLSVAGLLCACDAGAALDETYSETCQHTATESLYGLNIGAKQHRSNPGFQFDVAGFRNLGARWVRLEAVRDVAEPSQGGVAGCADRHPSDPTVCTMAAYYSESIRTLHDHGMRVLLLVDYGTVTYPTWDRTDSNVYVDKRIESYVQSPGWAGYVEHFEAELSAFVAELSELPDAWEIWNEPDQFAPYIYGGPTSPDAWGASGSGVPPQYYEAILAGAARVLRARDSGAVLVSGGVSSGNPQYLTDVVNGALVPGNALRQYDGLGVHVYRGPWSDNMAHYLHVSTRHNHTTAAGVSLPIWLTEAGSTGASELPEEQRVFTANLFDTVLGAVRSGTRWGPVFYFGYDDSIGAGGESFGLLDAGRAPRPAYSEYHSRAGTYAPCRVSGGIGAGAGAPSSPQALEKAVCAGEGITMYVAAELYLNLREAPTTDVRVIGTMDCGSEVTVFGAATTAPQWRIVDFAGQCGFAHSAYLAATAPACPEE